MNLCLLNRWTGFENDQDTAGCTPGGPYWQRNHRAQPTARGSLQRWGAQAISTCLGQTEYSWFEWWVCLLVCEINVFLPLSKTELVNQAPDLQNVSFIWHQLTSSEYEQQVKEKGTHKKFDFIHMIQVMKYGFNIGVLATPFSSVVCVKSGGPELSTVLPWAITSAVGPQTPNLIPYPPWFWSLFFTSFTMYGG